MKKAKELKDTAGVLAENSKVINIAVGDLAKNDSDVNSKSGIDFRFDRHESMEVLFQKMLEKHGESRN